MVVRTLLGFGAFARDMGITSDFRLWSDSSAAKFVGNVYGKHVDRSTVMYLLNIDGYQTQERDTCNRIGGDICDEVLTIVTHLLVLFRSY